MAIPLTAREPVEFTPPSLPKQFRDQAGNIRVGEDGKPVFRVLVRVPTMLERDNYHGTLVRGGVMSYTRQQIRDLCLAGVQHVLDRSEHEEKQALLRELWQVADAESLCEEEQQQKLRELAEKAQAAGEDLDPKMVKEELDAIQPAAAMDPQRRIEGTALSQELMSNFPPLKKALADLVEQDSKRARMNAEIYVKDFIGLEHRPDGNGRGGLQHHEIEYLRSHIGKEAFQELSDFITALQGIDEDEEKNLASLLASMSGPIGSTQSESTASSADGNSTAGRSTPTPGSGSRKTTRSSSASTKSSATKTVRSRKAGRTAARS